jgi:ADP-ribose pyrophosphatase
VGVDSLENARKELREEAGYRARYWQRLGKFAPYNGVSNEMCRVYVATELEHVEAAPEPTEELEVIDLDVDEIRQAIDSGEIWDGMTAVSFHLYETWRRRGDAT